MLENIEANHARDMKQYEFTHMNLSEFYVELLCTVNTVEVVPSFELGHSKSNAIEPNQSFVDATDLANNLCYSIII
jgi:hypothetical protein